MLILNEDKNRVAELEHLCKKLIKAIDENCIEMQDSVRDEKDIFITQRFIADELEELKRALFKE